MYTGQKVFGRFSISTEIQRRYTTSRCPHGIKIRLIIPIQHNPLQQQLRRLPPRLIPTIKLAQALGPEGTWRPIESPYRIDFENDPSATAPAQAGSDYRSAQ